MTVRVAELMTAAPFTVGPDEAVGRVRDMMLESGVHCMPVIDGDGFPLGIVTSWDLVELYGDDEPIRKAMTPRVLTIGEHQFSSEAATEMQTNFIHHLVVVGESGGVVGVLSSLDLLAELDQY